MTDWVTETVESLGYAGVALLMFLENIVPPIPSEVVMPAAGFAAQQGELSAWGVVLSGTAGSILGTLPFYYLGLWIGPERLKQLIDRRGRWLGLRRSDVDQAEQWFDRWGAWAVLLCRLVPGVRTLISLPAGFSRMPLGQFLVCTAVGTAGWTMLLTSAGWFLGRNYASVQPVLSTVAVLVLTGLAAWLAVFLWKRRRRRDHASAA